MTTDKGVWNLQQVRDKQLQSLWSYVGADPGELWVWGGNNHLDAMGILGQNNLTHYSSPVQVPGTWNDDPRHCVANSYSFCHTKSDGTLWAWGLNWGGALGQNNKIRYSSPVQIPGTTWEAGQSNGNSSWGIKTDGTFWHWGRNTNWSMGINQPSDYSRSSPVQLPGTTWSSDYGKHELSGVCSLSIKTDGTLWTWGTNGYGRLGLNNTTNYSSPKQVGSDTDWSQVTGGYTHSLFLKTDGTLWAAGEDGNGRLGINVGDNAGRRSSPTQVPGTTWSKVSAGYRHSVAIKTDGTLWAWGDNSSGQLGINANTSVDGYSSPVQVGSDTTWSKVTANDYAVVATKTDGTAWAWGNNGNGQLADNSVILRSSPTQIPGTNWSGNIGTASRSFFSIRS